MNIEFSSLPERIQIGVVMFGLSMGLCSMVAYWAWETWRTRDRKEHETTVDERSIW